MYPQILTLVKEAGDAPRLKSVNVHKFKTLKERILALDYLLTANAYMSEEQRAEFVSDVLTNGIQKESSSHGGSWVVKAAKTILGSLVGGGDTHPATPIVDLPRSVLEIDDRIFIARLSAIADRSPLLAGPATQAVEYAQAHFEDAIEKETKQLLPKIQNVQRKDCKEQITRKVDAEKKEREEQLRAQVLTALGSTFLSTSAR